MFNFETFNFWNNVLNLGISNISKSIHAIYGIYTVYIRRGNVADIVFGDTWQHIVLVNKSAGPLSRKRPLNALNNNNNNDINNYDSNIQNTNNNNNWTERVRMCAQVTRGVFVCACLWSVPIIYYYREVGIAVVVNSFFGFGYTSVRFAKMRSERECFPSLSLRQPYRAR